MSAPLYNTAILRLAASIPHAERLTLADATIDKRTPVCGSRIVIDVKMDGGRITALGQDVRACAFGQASASLMGAYAIGRSVVELGTARADLAAYLAGHRADPGDWPGLEAFAAARGHPARHAAILLPFAAVEEAANKAAMTKA